MAKSFFKKENPNFNNCGLIRRTICLYSWLVILPYKRTRKILFISLFFH